MMIFDALLLKSDGLSLSLLLSALSCSCGVDLHVFEWDRCE